MQQLPLRFQLRERTAALHAAVDAAVGAFDDRPAYRRYLAGLHAFRAPCEAALAGRPSPEFLGTWRFVPIAPLIEADMADMGMSPGHRGADGDRGDFGADEAVAGWLYVLEGSSMGARVLAVRACSLGLDAGFGARHLAVQGGDPGHFRAFAERLDAAGLDCERVVAAANVAFAAAERAFVSARDEGVADVRS